MIKRSEFPTLLAVCLASTIGGLPFNALPILLGSLSEQFSLSAQSAGLLGSVCFFGYLIGTLSSVVIVKRFCLQKLTILCAALLCVLLIISAKSQETVQTYIWFGVGYCAALMTCLGLMLLGAMPNKEQVLGFRQGTELTVTAAVLFIIPAYITYQYGYVGTVIAIAVVIAILSVSSFFLPKGRQEYSQSVLFKEQIKIPLKAWAALGIFLLFATGNIALWAFLERMGHEIALDPTQQGIIFAILKVLGGLAAFSVIFVGNRIGYKAPYYIIAVVLFLGLYLIFLGMNKNSPSFYFFAAGVWIWEVAFTWGCVYQTAAVARFDPTNKAIMLIPTAFALSAMIGPYSGGLLMTQGSSILLVFTATMSVLALICYVGPMYRWQNRV